MAVKLAVVVLSVITIFMWIDYKLFLREEEIGEVAFVISITCGFVLLLLLITWRFFAQRYEDHSAWEERRRTVSWRGQLFFYSLILVIFELYALITAEFEAAGILLLVLVVLALPFSWSKWFRKTRAVRSLTAQTRILFRHNGEETG